MARGQAFETMMLVISVIVALAILGVLLNILGFINPDQLGGDPRSTISDNIRDLNGRGYGVSPPKKVTFASGSNVYVKEIVNNLPVSDKEVKIFCADGPSTEAMCGTGGDLPLSINSAGTSITVNKKIEATIVTCANEQKKTQPRYCIVVAHTSEKGLATEKCVSS
ncbi:MAG: hypothetical protein AABX01_02495, partial [Candidatus Micrarchaeota archaeon]